VRPRRGSNGSRLSGWPRCDHGRGAWPHKEPVGCVYSVGAIIYARGRPNRVLGVFGYHEVFHALVIAAAALHYAVVAFAVLPRG
jgi:hypothetical protein